MRGVNDLGQCGERAGPTGPSIRGIRYTGWSWPGASSHPTLRRHHLLLLELGLCSRRMTRFEHPAAEFWNLLAPLHASIEDHFFDRRSVRHIVPRLESPVLVVGAGQGLLVAELRKQGCECDGLDLSSEMIRYARERRGLALFHGDARAMPFAEGSYRTIIYATGVIDFIPDEEEIRRILNEGRRVVASSGAIFVGFYRLSPILEEFSKRVGLLRDNLMSHRESLESYLLSPVQMVDWIANRAGVGRLRAATWFVRIAMFASIQEKMMTFRMQRLLQKIDAKPLIQSAAEQQAYRNEAEIRKLFGRLAIPVKRLETLAGCFIVQI